MIEIGFGLICRSDREMPRGRATAESCELWKDIPHPVRAFGAASDLSDRAGIDGCLGFDEAVERTGVGHRQSKAGSATGGKTCVTVRLPFGKGSRTSAADTFGSSQSSH